MWKGLEVQRWVDCIGSARRSGRMEGPCLGEQRRWGEGERAQVLDPRLCPEGQECQCRISSRRPVLPFGGSLWARVWSMQGAQVSGQGGGGRQAEGCPGGSIHRPRAWMRWEEGPPASGLGLQVNGGAQKPLTCGRGRQDVWLWTC